MKNSAHFLSGTAVISCAASQILLWVSVVAQAAEIPLGREFINSLEMQLVRVEPGTFKMGQVETPLASELLPLYRGRGRFDDLFRGDPDEHPVHEVTLTEPFYLGRHEVTNSESK